MPGLTNSFQAALSASIADLSGLSFDVKPEKQSSVTSSSFVKSTDATKTPPAFSVSPKPFPTTTSEKASTPSSFTFDNYSFQSPIDTFNPTPSKRQHGLKTIRRLDYRDPSPVVFGGRGSVWPGPRYAENHQNRPIPVPFTSEPKIPAAPPQRKAPPMASTTPVTFFSDASPAPRPKEPNTKTKTSRQAKWR